MIELQQMTPEVYYKKSRDFQFIGRLYDVILNYIKTSSDQIKNLPFSDNSDIKWLDLLAMTLGFQSKHDYNVNQLKSLCSAFVEIIRNKGSLKSIELACDALLNAEGIKKRAVVKMSEEQEFTVDILVPEQLSDFNLLKDLLNYILPAGLSVNIFIASEERLGNTNSVFKYKDDITVNTSKLDTDLSVVSSELQSELDKSSLPKDIAGRVQNITVVKNIKNKQ